VIVYIVVIVALLFAIFDFEGYGFKGFQF